MTSPCNPGIYESKWRMSTATGNFFGEQIWVIISVEVSGTLAITQQMSKLDELGKVLLCLVFCGIRLLTAGTRQGDNNENNPFRTGSIEQME